MKFLVFLLLLLSIPCSVKPDIFSEIYDKLSSQFVGAAASTSMFHMLMVPSSVDYSSFNAAEILSKGKTEAREHFARYALASVELLNQIPHPSASMAKKGNLASVYSNILQQMKPLARHDIDSNTLLKAQNTLFDYSLDPDSLTYEEVEKAEYTAYKKLLTDTRKVQAQILNENIQLLTVSRDIADQENALKRLQNSDLHIGQSRINIEKLLNEKLAEKDEKVQTCPTLTSGSDCTTNGCVWTPEPTEEKEKEKDEEDKTKVSDKGKCTAPPQGTSEEKKDKDKVNQDERKKTVDDIIATKTKLIKQKEEKETLISDLKVILQQGRDELVRYSRVDKAHKTYMECFDTGFFNQKDDAIDKLESNRLGLTDTYLTYLGVNPWNPSSLILPTSIKINGSFTSSKQTSDSLNAYARTKYGGWWWRASAEASGGSSDQTAESESTRVEIDMDVFSIDIVRPWLDLDFLQSFRWHLPTRSDEYVSPGKLDKIQTQTSKDYLMPLKIDRVIISEEATFRFCQAKSSSASKETHASASMSGGFGPFSLGGGGSSSSSASESSHEETCSEVSVTDKTILGYVSSVVPRLPGGEEKP